MRIFIAILGTLNLLACGIVADTGGPWPLVAFNAITGVLLLYAAADWNRVRR